MIRFEHEPFSPLDPAAVIDGIVESVLELTPGALPHHVVRHVATNLVMGVFENVEKANKDLHASTGLNERSKFSIGNLRKGESYIRFGGKGYIHGENDNTHG